MLGSNDRNSVRRTSSRSAIAGLTLTGLAAGTAFGAGAPPPGPGETHVPYEMGVFDATTQVQSVGTHLATPGDRYRYTYVIDDEYFGNEQYKLERALFGVHILDADYSGDSGDGAPEWGAILIDGEARTTVGKAGVLTDLVEMKSDPEIPSGLPPYIYVVTDLVIDDGKLVLEVVNLNSNGGEDMSADYGDFNMLRAGLHLYYSKVGE